MIKQNEIRFRDIPGHQTHSKPPSAKPSHRTWRRGLAILTLLASGVTINSSAQEVFYDDFMNATLDPVKWRVDSTPFESGTTDVTLTVGGGYLTFSGTDTAGWWGGAAVMTVPTFKASPETNLVFTVERTSEFGIGTASRSAMWITDAERKNFVFFADNRGEGNWTYNRKIGATGDNPTGSGTAIGALNQPPYTDAGTHTMKAVVNGQSVKLYLDDVFGAEVAFPFSSGIVFGLGSYARAVNDSTGSTFANPRVTAERTVLFTTGAGDIQNYAEINQGELATNISVKIPAGQNATQPFTVRVKSSDPAVAVPAGAVGDTLTLTFPAGGPSVMTVPVQALKIGGATLTLANDAGVLAGNNLALVVAYTSAGVILQDDFSGASYDTTKWTVNNQGFETGTGSMTITTTGGTLKVSGGLSEQYWGGISLKTVSPFLATKDMPLVFEMDRVSIARTGTAARSGVFITTADRSRFVWFGHNFGEAAAWGVNVNPGNPTGGGTGIPAFSAMNNGGAHHMRAVADGSTVKVYLDGVYGGSFPFPVSTGIYFEVGTYARAMGDTVNAVYDNVKIGAEYSPVTAAPSSVVVAANELDQKVTVGVSPAMVRAGPVSVTISSRNPGVAIPAGAVNGALTLNFPAGGPATNTFTVTPVGVGVTTFDLTNAQGATVMNSVDVTVIESLFTLLSDDFSGTAFNPAKWRIDAQGFEVDSSVTNDSYITVTNGTAQIYAISGGIGDGAGIWWGGYAFATKQTFSASPTAPVSFEIDRVSLVGTGAERRSSILITDSSRQNWVMFSENDLNGGWIYDVSSGSFRQNNTGIPAFSSAALRDGGLHRMKMLADGSTVKLYLDGIFGISVPFALSNGIVFEFGGYARSFPDSIRATFDNALIRGPIPNIYATPSSVTLASDQNTSDTITLTVPAQLHETNTAHIVITSSDPSVAVPSGGAGGSLTLSFAPGAPDTQTFQVSRTGYGQTTLTLSNDVGAPSPAPILVLLQNASPATLLSDTFSSTGLSSQWVLNTGFRFEPQYASVAEGMANVNSEQLEITMTVVSNYWPGILLTTTTNFQASMTDPVTFEVDRVAHYGGGTGSRSGIYIMDASGSNFVLFSDLSEGNLNWNFNRNIGQAGDNPTGGGTAIAAFNDPIYRDFLLHRVKITADGRVARLYLDGVFGTEVPFPFSSGLKFGIMAAGRAEMDTITAYFDNALVTGSGKSVAPAKLGVKLDGGNVVISWTGAGTLQQSGSPAGAWVDIPSASSPFVIQAAELTGRKFYRLRQ